MARAKTSRKAASRISKKTEARIVELSLQNPDFGAKRLVPLLKQEKVSVSSSQIYSILKRHGLQTREKRLAGIEKQTPQKAKSPPAKASTKLADETAEQIVEISLQNPDFGAKRLLPLLKESGIDASTSKVYSILKRRGLQTRKLRLARLDGLRRVQDAPATEKAPAELAPEIEERIVEVSLQNPGSGTRLLAGLLAGEGISISSSALYSLLKRHGLQTSALRTSRVDLLHLTETGLPAVETAAPDPVMISSAAKEPGISEIRPAASALSVPVKSPHRARWFFYLADFCLLALVGYLGYLGYHTVLNFRQVKFQPEAVAAVQPEPARRAVQPQIAAEPLRGYHKIWERNLFNIPEKTALSPKPEIPIEKIALAKKSIGLKLVGTVVADDATFSRAIVHVSKTREQDAYREGDQAGKAKIKKILRNKVVITTDKGDELLTINDEDFGKGGRAASKRGRVPRNLKSSQLNAGEMRFDVSGSPLPRRKGRSINLKQDEVAASLADTDQLLQELTISPFMLDDQPAGFIISKIPRGSILTKMGLRNGYVVTQLNDQEISSPDQAAEFFKTLAEGGEVTIQVRRSRGVRRNPRQINLNIE